jgi:cell division protein FtsQ
LDGTVDPRSERGPARVWRAAALAGAVLVLAGGLAALTRTGVFHVRNVEVVGAEHLSRAQVVELTGITDATDAVWLDEGEVEARLEQNAWIADASVTVTLPWTVEVNVVERLPVAVVQGDLGTMLVGDDGAVLGAVAQRAGLPLIHVPPIRLHLGSRVGIEGAARALAALGPEIVPLVRRVEVDVDGSLEMILRDGLRIAYGRPGSFERKADAIADALRWADDAGERVRTLNVLAPGAPALTLG